MRRFAIWAAGYSGSVTRTAAPEDLEHLAKLGSTVIATALWTATTWAIAASAFGTPATLSETIAVIAAAAAAGFCFVLLYDRSVLYTIDARVDGGMPIMWLAFRLAIVLAIGVFTSERLYPVILKAELQEEALVDRELADAGRHERLERRFGTPELARQADAAAGEARRLEAEEARTPPEIQSAIDGARVCADAVNAERRRLVSAGYTAREAARRVGGRARICAAQHSEALGRLASYRETMRVRIVEMRAQASSFRARHADAVAVVQERVAEGHSVDAQSLTPQSSNVFWKVIRNNPVALAKALILLIIITSIELLPFLIKAFAGPTGLGARLGAAREAGVVDARTRLACHRNESEIALAASEAITEAMRTALEGTQVREFMRAHCVQQAETLAPFEIALRTLRMAESQTREIQSLAARTPELMEMAHALLAGAIREAGENLRPFRI